MSASIHPGRRQRQLALALAVPALIVTLAVSGVEVWRVLAPSRAQVGYRSYGSLGEAIAMDDVHGAHAFIERGQSPDALITVYDPALTGRQPVLVPPIVWAAAAGRRTIVLMLLAEGVTFERDTDRASACLADRLGFPQIAADLRRLAGRPLASPCPTLPPGPPLATLTAIPAGIQDAGQGH